MKEGKSICYAQLIKLIVFALSKWQVYFELLEILSAAQNDCPFRKSHPRIGALEEEFMEQIAQK